MDAPHSHLRRFSLMLVLALALAWLPEPAHAQQDEFNIDFGPGLYVYALALGAVLVPTAAFLGADVVLAAQGRSLPEAPAVLELLLVGIPWLVLGGLVLGDLDNDDLGIGMCALGVAFSAHAIASIAVDERSEAHVRAGPAFALTPWLGRGTAGAGMAARF